MGKVKNLVLAGAFAVTTGLAGILGGCEGCTVPVIGESYGLSKIEETKLGEGYERPEGLSISEENRFSIKGLDYLGTEYSGVFTTRPTFNSPLAGFDFFYKPSVYGTLDEILSEVPLFEIPSDYLSDFATTFYDAYDSEGNLMYRPSVVLSSLLANNSVYLSSNASNKLFRFFYDTESKQFNFEVFKETDELTGITDMYYDSLENKIYFAQMNLFYPYLDGSLPPEPGDDIGGVIVYDLIKQNRIASIDLDTSEKTITQEFLLPEPSSPISSYVLISLPSENLTYQDCEFGENDIITLMRDSKNNFYVSNALERKIYKASFIEEGKYDISSVIEDILPATSIALDYGETYLYFPVVPLLKRNTDYSWGVASPPKLMRYSLLEDILEEVYSYNLTEEDLATQGIQEVPVGNVIYPSSFVCSLDISETESDINFLTATTLTEDITKLTATKVAP